MKNNFKKLTRDEQLMVNGGSFGQKLICKRADRGYCQTLNIPNGSNCGFGGNSSALLCSGILGGSADPDPTPGSPGGLGYYYSNETNQCFTC